MVGLDTPTLLGRGHDTRDTERTLPARVIDPCDINQAIIDGSERIHDHSTTGILSIVDHHEGGTDASLAVWLVIDAQLVAILHEPTAQSLQVGA